MQIAVLDNDDKQATAVCRILGNAGHVCETFANRSALQTRLHLQQAALLIVGTHPADVACQPEAATLPTLFIVAPAMEDQVTAALGTGLADYIVKPIRRHELAMRVQVLLRRAYPELAAPEPVRFGTYVFDTHACRATSAGQPVELTQKEFELALLFFRNINRPLSRAYILESIWSRDADIPSRTVDTHVSRVRNKLGLHPERGFRLAPVYSYGYRLEQLAGQTDRI